MKTSRKLWLTGTLTAALTLGGCWHNNDDSPAPPVTEVPDSAGASVAAFVSFLTALGTDDESSEPLIIKDTFAVPPDEDGEPAPLT